MQAWDSFLVKAEADSPYAGTAGCVVAIDRAAGTVTGRMDKDGATVTFVSPDHDLQRLG
jgi:hypothetical protein